MLQLSKNSLVTDVAKTQVEIRKLEIDWYCDNYSTIAGQAAMLAGFAFTQLTTPMPEHNEPGFVLEFSYLFLTCTSIGLELSAIVLSTFLSLWGPSLALRGRAGSNDLHRAVKCLSDYQEFVFLYFMVGWVVFFISNIMQIWIYFPRRVALVVTFPLSFFIILITWYWIDLTARLRVHDDEVVHGKIDAFAPYEYIGDIDNHLATQVSTNGKAPEEGHCPIHGQDETAWASRVEA